MRHNLLFASAGLLLILAAGCSSYNQEPTPAPVSTSAGAAAQLATAPATAPAGTAVARASTPPAATPPTACASTPAAIPSVIAGVPPIPAGVQTVTTASGLRYADIHAGDGAAATSGQTATVQYTGWLPDGTKFDSSVDRNQPFSFPLGGGQVIKGWDEGVAGMKVNGERMLIVPPDLGYGNRAAGGVIPACATLIFDVRLLSVK